MSDELLRFLKDARRGRLKVYLGMAAGVGKTVAMLREARQLRAAGVDVVAGLIEAHGREETLAEVGDLPIVPRRTVDYRGVPLEEMDVEAVLARRPDVALVDEIAHTNVPGGRHDKRYEDVEALLAAGISVIGALNVQHLESLHDCVLRETGVDVRERVPDRFVQGADEIVVVDLAPEELTTRLRAGKIYPPEKVERALGAFFRPDKLAALRQLALREVANAVEIRARASAPEGRPDDEGEREARGVADLERVLVAMSSRPSATRRLLRRGARLAGGPNSVWYVAYVRTPGEAPERIDSASLRSLADNVDLAKELGAVVVRLEGEDVAEALARFARERDVTHAIFGRTRHPAWRERLQGSVLDRFMRLVPEVDVVVVGTPRSARGEAS